jgi:hyperosmotically inducible protein
MKAIAIGVTALCVTLFTGCNREPSDHPTTDQGTAAEASTGSSRTNSPGAASQTESPAVQQSRNTEAAASKPADNTGKNVRDRSAAAVTPGAQSEASADVEVTRRVRQALTQDKQLSTLAKNIKVMDTGNGNVVLRGPVNSDAERQQIEQLAKGVEGVTAVDNQLEVKTNQ